jgi:hypothetical protein
LEKFLIVLGYAWRVLVNLIRLAIVLAVFSSLHTQFEFIVVSILGFIYLTIATVGSLHVMMSTQVALAFDRDLTRIRSLLGDETVDDHKAEMEEQSKVINRQFNKVYFIDMVFNSIIWIICFYHLFFAT